MKDTDRSTHGNIAWLRDCSAVIRATPALWSLWWPILTVCEAEAERLERRVAHRRQLPAGVNGAEVIDLAEWRRRKSAALAWRRQQAGDAA
jgi:hypothetical protein